MKQLRPVSLIRGLRHRQTDAEIALWTKLRNRRFEGVKFRRQHPVDNYIVDFVSLDAKLIIELDGGQHNDSSAISEDNLRTQHLETKGYEVLRFWNNDVFNNIDGVLEKIRQCLDSRLHPQLKPLPQRERLKELK